ncbi:hypothetical protein LCGC14_2471460 [marine sediment metagenome]|uniref:4-aminobutyrate aminotransferase n=1 Tax=marine sediment metagenome TaxID=412755 RepID=A0A0F9BY29_9ZZZZ
MSSTVKKSSRKSANKAKTAPQMKVVEANPATQSNGQTNADLVARRDAAVPRGVASAAPIYAKYAENAELWDVEGNRYIDFVGGIGVLNTGHRHPKVIEAAKAQEDNYTHTSFQVVPYGPYVELAEKLNALAPGDAPKKTLLVTTGAEAVENAVKIARAATGRSGIIAFTGGYQRGRKRRHRRRDGRGRGRRALHPYRRGLGRIGDDLP